ncbi:MAG: class I SAM-dependent methyltransferase [Proteobacteria bacterium]|nr:class I SAM-dependent methyltransferase [Pseudomonadota bacterium]
MKKTFLTILLCALGTYDAHGSAVDEKAILGEFKHFIAQKVLPWADPRILNDLQKAQLALACTQEPPLQRIPELQPDGKDYVLDPGFSFGAIEAPLVEALTFVRRTYEERRAQALARDPTLQGPALDKLSRVRIMDLGAGHGVNMWKFVVAGAHVTAVEPQRSLLSRTVNVLWDMLDKAVPFLPKGVTKKDVSHFVGNEASQALVKEHFQNTFDGVYASQLLHCLSPKEALECVALIPNVLKDRGHLWVRELGGFAHNGAGLDKAVYRDQLSQQKRFPGYMMRNIKPYLLQEDTTFPDFVPLEEGDDYPSRHRYPGGFVKGGVLSHAQKVQLLAAKAMGEEFSYQHRSYFSFDPQSLLGLFEGTAFDMKALYWEGLMDVTPIKPDEMTYSGPGDTQGRRLYLLAMRQTRSTTSGISSPGESS